MITLFVILSFLSFTIGTDIEYPVEPTLVCTEDEVLNPCPNYCSFVDACDQIITGLPRPCPPPPPGYKCQPTCICKNELARIDSKCEPVQKCCKDINEKITDCPAPCDETCDGKPAADCRLSPCFKKGCRCKYGYVRDDKGSCIPKTQCAKYQCTGPNEEYSECTNPCPPGAMCFAPCIPGCVCKPGFVRKDGICVKETPQGKCTGPNEEYSDCIKFTCPPGRKCPAIACRSGCVCKNGFVRKNGVCVKKIFIPKPTISPPIEIITFAPRPTPDEILKNQ